MGLSFVPISVLWLLTVRDVKQRTMGSALGWVWLLLQPAFLLLTYTFVFGVVLQVQFSPGAGTLSFALYLMAGLMPFMAFRESVERGGKALIANRQLVQRVLTPPSVYPMVVALGSLVTEAIGLGLLVLAVLMIGEGLTPWVLLLPLVIFTRLLLSLALAWLVSILTVFVRDLSQLVNLLLTMLFFATPILYPLSRVPERFQWLFELNPFYHLVSAYRAVIIDGVSPPVGFFWLLLLGVLLVVLAWRFFGATVERAKDLL